MEVRKTYDSHNLSEPTVTLTITAEEGFRIFLTLNEARNMYLNELVVGADSNDRTVEDELFYYTELSVITKMMYDMVENHDSQNREFFHSFFIELPQPQTDTD